MKRRSNLLVIIGVAVLVLGGLIVLLVLSNDDDDDGGTAGDTSASVLIAGQDISAGTRGVDIISGGLVETRNVPPDQRAPGALSSAAELTGFIVTSDIESGQQIVATSLRSETVRRNIIQIPEGKQALAVSIPFVPGVAGYVGPGDLVNVYANVEGAAPAPGQPAPPANAVLPLTKLVVSGVEVLDVSTEVAPRVAAQDQQAERPSGTQITYLLALDAAEAERIIFLTTNESLYLTLVPEGQPPSATPGRNYGNALQPGAA